MEIKLLKVSCLEKMMPTVQPREFDGCVEGFLNEIVSFQVAYRLEGENPCMREFVSVHVESPIAAYVRARWVRYVPVMFPTFPNADDNYLTKEPALIADPITDITPDNVMPVFSGHWEALWLDVDAGEEIPAGEYPIDVILKPYNGDEPVSVRFIYSRLNASLPRQALIHTKWFHYDGLCDQYDVEMFSEKFWQIAENYIKLFAKRTMNCLLTPIHTPPLDTAVGGERRTCQLIDIEKTENGYAFGFEKFERFIRMAENCGIEYFEMAHLFTQWGAAHAPKIVAKVNGEEKRIFGWETEATGEEYVAFLQQYLTALVGKIDEMGIREKCIFHISDEPNETMVENYMKARLAVKDKLSGFPIVDALSHLELYQSGAVEHPVPCNDHIGPFLEAKVPHLWTYYCCGQVKDVSNAFVAMPSQRTRVIGLQMFKYDIEGFLQWGFNFYNNMHSTHDVNPFLSGDGDGFVPSGDCFVVYPGKKGQPIESIRVMLFDEAVNDMRALQMLAGLTNKENAVALMEEGVEPIDFASYPRDADYILNMRKRVNKAIMNALKE